PADAADAAARTAVRPRGQARRLWHQDALGDQPRVKRRDRRDRRAAVRGRRTHRPTWADADPRARGLDQKPGEEGRRGDPVRRVEKADRRAAGRPAGNVQVDPARRRRPLHAADQSSACRPGRRPLRRLYPRRRLPAARRQSRHDRELLARACPGPSRLDERRRIRDGPCPIDRRDPPRLHRHLTNAEALDALNGSIKLLPGEGLTIQTLPRNETRATTRLYLITPPALDPDRFAGDLEEALAGGDVACLQLRLKEVDDATVRRAARVLQPIAQ